MAWANKSRSELRKYYKEYRRKNRKRIRENHAQWKKNNSVHHAFQRKQYYLKNKAAIIRAARDYYFAHQDESNARIKLWQKNKRLQAINRFGGKCRCCAYREHPEILQFYLSVSVKSKASGFWFALKNPEKVELLCPNCRQKKVLKRLRTKRPSPYALLARKLCRKVVLDFDGKCICCGMRDVDCLELDHIIARWKQGLRKTMKTEIEALSHPERFQLLCANCHRIKTNADGFPWDGGRRPRRSL